MYRTVQLVLGGVLAVVFGLSWLSRRHPGVAWLRRLRYDPPELSEEQRARMRRRADVQAGVEMILMGVVLPMGYFALTVMFFNSPTPTATALVLGCSVVLIGLGVTALVRSRRG